ncbi:MAG: signal peptidase II [Fimbriimonadales bacterium]
MVDKRVNVTPFIIWSAGLILLDQATKALARGNMAEGGFITVIPHVLDFTLVFNQGIAFGMLQGWGGWLAPIALAMTGFAFWMYVKREPSDKMQALVAILVAGGAIGNVIDRLAMGRVTDFINIRIIPVFNFADTYITIAFLVMAALILRPEKKPDSEPAA